MPGDARKVLNALAIAFATGFVSKAGGKAFDKLTAALQRESEAPPNKLQTVPSWTFIGNAYWGEDGYYYLHSGYDWYVLHPYDRTWIQVQVPTFQLFDQQDVYLGSNGITYLQNVRGLFAFSPNYGWVQIG